MINFSGVKTSTVSEILQTSATGNKDEDSKQLAVNCHKQLGWCSSIHWTNVFVLSVFQNVVVLRQIKEIKMHSFIITLFKNIFPLKPHGLGTIYKMLTQFRTPMNWISADSAFVLVVVDLHRTWVHSWHCLSPACPGPVSGCWAGQCAQSTPCYKHWLSSADQEANRLSVQTEEFIAHSITISS